MIIQDINLTGFKSFDVTTGLDLTLIENKSILSARGENKRFLFSALLAILYGLSDEEKAAFKDKESIVFTGRTNLKFDDYILHIERDFETGIVAVLSEGKNKSKPIFQGKDIDLGDKERPYIHILESFFSIIDKSFLMEVCSNNLQLDKSTFGEVLDLLYLFLRPKFKLAAIRRLIDSSTKIITGTSAGKNNLHGLQESKTRVQLLKNIKKINQSATSIKSDISKFKKYWNLFSTIPQRNGSTDATLKQRYPLIYSQDASKIKKDMQVLQKLQTSYKEIYREIQNLNNNKTEYDTLLNQKLLVYANLPDTFIEDFQHYQHLSIDLAHMKNEYDKLAIKIGILQIALNQKKKNERLTYSVVLIMILGLGLLSFPQEIIHILGVMGLAAGSIFLIFRKIKQNIIFIIETTHLKQSLQKKKIRAVEKDIVNLRNQSYLLDDLEYIDTHIERFKKYKQVKYKLEMIRNKKLVLQRKLSSREYSEMLPKLERQYKDLLALNPEEGLDTYLNEFEKLQKHTDAKDWATIKSEKLLPLQKIIVKYQTMHKELLKIKEHIKDFLSSDIIEKDIDLKIAESERILLQVRQKLKIENSLN
jgi:hypothetical protein